ncbi:TPA: hypothetical protein ACMUBG_003019 [Enterococcus faecalis]
MKNKIKKKVKYFTAVIQTIIGLGWIEGFCCKVLNLLSNKVE